jgi:hypothetical protein
MLLHVVPQETGNDYSLIRSLEFVTKASSKVRRSIVKAFESFESSRI